MEKMNASFDLNHKRTFTHEPTTNKLATTASN